MAKKPVGRFVFREDLDMNDYQKIMIEQNQTIIQLLSLQHSDLFHGALNQAIIKTYHDALKPFTLKGEANLDNLSEEQKSMYLNIKRRQDEGENVDSLIKEFGFEDLFED